MKPYRFRTVIWAFLVSLIVLVPHLTQSAARRPDSVKKKDNVGHVDWIRNGVAKKIKVTSKERKLYIGVAELARMSQSQLRWQPVTEQACLSRVDGLLCFNWGRHRIYRNNDILPKRYTLLYDNKNLLVPISFVSSRDFEEFSKTSLSFNRKTYVLKQDSPVTLHFPPVENYGDRYRAQVTFTEKTPYQIVEMKPKRIWLRFLQGRFSSNQTFEGDEIIKEVRVIQKRKSADLVLKLGRKAGSHDIFFDKATDRLVIDVGTNGKILPKTLNLEPATVESGIEAKAAKAAKKGIRTVVIDAGHGGIDSGAIGGRGTYEKTINLKVAKALASELKKRKGVRVLMTRTKDEFLTLARRSEIANNAKADLFVSIHCNSSLTSKAKGFEVYFLSPEATDEAAAAVARKENSVIELEKTRGESSKLNQLLASMAVYNFINESSKFAARLCLGVKGKSPVKKTDVREANFYVLRGAQMPGVLVEMEYLSNPVSELKLRSSRWRNQVVRGLADGIVQYLKKDLTVASKK